MVDKLESQRLMWERRLAWATRLDRTGKLLWLVVLAFLIFDAWSRGGNAAWHVRVIFAMVFGLSCWLSASLGVWATGFLVWLDMTEPTEDRIY